ncbi:SIR2 family protein [Rathayibacter sp. AY1A7]|uniref:SIR2 family NAD-dependent protein deacylase n=1 Tax=Rathayibacter sp. AY1A7 TaxID=2080524 RepID=UPI0015E41BDC|nr:SIR2 family protein [Rathayibacter sp. AY1A7]
MSWTELLTFLLDDVLPARVGSRPRARSRIASRITAGDLLSAAQAIEALYEERGHAAGFRSKIVAATDGPVDAPFQPGRAHLLLGELNPRTLITTNYDRVLERHFGTGYSSYTFNSTAIAPAVRRGEFTLIKLHGTFEQPQDLILTRLDFTRLRREGQQALEVLAALVLTRTVLFVGYSLADPDLQLVLEDQFGRRGANAGHYMLSHSASHDAVDRRIVKEAFGVEMLTYSGDVSTGFIEALEALVDEVRALRVTIPSIP